MPHLFYMSKCYTSFQNFTLVKTRELARALDHECPSVKQLDNYTVWQRGFCSNGVQIQSTLRSILKYRFLGSLPVWQSTVSASVPRDSEAGSPRTALRNALKDLSLLPQAASQDRASTHVVQPKGTPPIHLCSWAPTLHPVPFTRLRGPGG